MFRHEIFILTAALFCLSVTNSNPFSKSYVKPEAPSDEKKKDAVPTYLAKQDYTKCLIINDSPSRSASQNSFTFVNGCNVPLYINACIMDNFGETKLYQSGKSIKVGAYYKVFTPPFMRADRFEWTADNKDAPIPTLCQIKK